MTAKRLFVSVLLFAGLASLAGCQSADKGAVVAPAPAASNVPPPPVPNKPVIKPAGSGGGAAAPSSGQTTP